MEWPLDQTSNDTFSVVRWEKRTSNKYGHLIRKKTKLRMIDWVRFDRQKSNNTLFVVRFGLI